MEELLRPKERVGGSSPSRGTVFFYSDQEFLLWSDRTEAVFARFLPHPTAALQAASGRLGMRRLPALFGCAVLLIEHDMDLVFTFATRMTVLVNGAVLTDGTPAEIAADPRVRAVYLGDSLSGTTHDQGTTTGAAHG